MNETASNETSSKPAGNFALENIQKDLRVTQHNSLVVNEFAKLNIEKATNNIDKRALNMFNVFDKSS